MRLPNLCFYVYVLFRPWDGSPFYVGKGKRDRWNLHPKKSNNPHVISIFRKAVRLGLEVPKIKIRQGLSEAEAFEVERALIAAIGRKNLGLGPLANLTDGGEGTSGPSAQTIEKRAAKLRGKPRPKEMCEQISAVLMGHDVSVETRIKIGDKSKAMWADPTKRPILCQAIKDRNYSPSPEVRQQVSAFHSGRKRTPETRRRLRAAALLREAKRREAKIKAEIPHTR